MHKTILLTGGTGFLGSHLLGEILRTGEYRVIVLKRKTSSMAKILKVCPDAREKALFFELDGEDSIARLFGEHKIDIIIHTATEYGRGGMMPSAVLGSNLIFPLTLIEQGLRQGLELFINTDSYFNKPNQSYTTLLDYSLSKKSLNLWLEYLSARCKVVNLRLEHLYGDYDSPGKFCESVIRSVAIRKEKSVSLTSGEQKRDFVFVDDVCGAYMAVLRNYGGYYFSYLTCDVGTGTAVPLRDFVSYVKECSGSPTELRFGDIPYRDDEMMISVADTQFLRNWGFEAKTSYRQGIEKIIGRYTKEGCLQ